MKKMATTMPVTAEHMTTMFKVVGAPLPTPAISMAGVEVRVPVRTGVARVRTGCNRVCAGDVILVRKGCVRVRVGVDIRVRLSAGAGVRVRGDGARMFLFEGTMGRVGSGNWIRLFDGVPVRLFKRGWVRCLFEGVWICGLGFRVWDGSVRGGLI